MRRCQPNILRSLLNTGLAVSYILTLLLGSGMHLHGSLAHDSGEEAVPSHVVSIHAHNDHAEESGTPAVEPQERDGHAHPIVQLQLSALISFNKTVRHASAGLPPPDFLVLNGIQTPHDALCCFALRSTHAPPRARLELPSILLGRSPPVA